MPLSEARIRNTKPRGKPYRLSDGRGLYLEVRPSGTRLWRYRYRLSGKENLFAMGAYPEVKLAEAREQRDSARKLVRNSIHPSHHRRTTQLESAFQNANTFEAVAREWLNENKSTWARASHRQRERLLERDVFPHIGAIPMKQIEPSHAYAVLKRLQVRAPQMAAIARQAFAAISRLAIRTSRGTIDLGYPLRDAVKTKPTEHKRPMSPKEIPAFFEELGRYAGYPATRAAVRMLWWTLARPTEVLGIRWDEVDLESATWTVPAARMKMRNAHRVPLPTQAVELLTSMRLVTPASEFVFPGRTNPRKPSSHTILVKAFYSMGYKDRITPHAIRVTGRTILGEQGHPRELLERQLAHREKKEVRAYDQGDRLEARRPIMQGWADYLNALVAGRPVTNLAEAKKRKRA
jgi:integrase